MPAKKSAKPLVVKGREVDPKDVERIKGKLARATPLTIIGIVAGIMVELIKTYGPELAPLILKAIEKLFNKEQADA